MYSKGNVDGKVVGECESDPDDVYSDDIALNFKVEGDVADGADHGGCDDGDADDVDPLVSL